MYSESSEKAKYFPVDSLITFLKSQNQRKSEKYEKMEKKNDKTLRNSTPTEQFLPGKLKRRCNIFIGLIVLVKKIRNW
jgi:hypothetical protein